MTVLRSLIAVKYVHNAVCQHALSEIKDSHLEWKEMPIIGKEKQAAERLTGLSINQPLDQSQLSVARLCDFSSLSGTVCSFS